MNIAHDGRGGWRSAPWRQIEVWKPDIEVRRAEGGVIYISQRPPLPYYRDRITQALVEQAARTPDRTLFAERDPDGGWRKVSYAETVGAAMSIGQYLLDAGLGPRRPLAILSGNSVDHALLALAAIHVGIPYAAISPAYSLVSTDFARLREVFETLEPGMVYAAEAAPFAAAIEAVAKPGTRQLFSIGAADPSQSFADALATEPTKAVDAAFAAITPETVAKFLFTSGSTGKPKAVVNTHRMICSNQVMVRETYAYMKKEPPVFLDWSPWHHTAGGNKLFFMPIFNGGTLYIDDGRPTGKDILKTVRNLREVHPTWYFNVPKGYEALIPHLEADAALSAGFFRDVKMLWYAGASMAQHTWDALDRLSVAATGKRVLLATGLGATETAPATLMCTWPQEKAGNVGLPCHGVTLKLVPLEGKYDARVKGPNITPGYWNAPELTKAAFDEEGFYRFGDALRFADPEDPSKGFFFDGRTAENFKLDTGTWVATGALRTTFVNHFGDIVRDVAIAGPDRPQLGALVFPDIGALRRIAADLPADAAPDQLFAHHGVRQTFLSLLRSFGEHSTGSSNFVRRLLLVDPPPTIDSGELADKGSLNQRAVLARRADLVEELYSGSERVIAI